MKKVISTDKAPAAIGPYSQAIEVGNMVYTSGIIPVDPATGEIPEGSVAQAEQGIADEHRQADSHVFRQQRAAVVEEIARTVGNLLVFRPEIAADHGCFKQAADQRAQGRAADLKPRHAQLAEDENPVEEDV